METPYIIAIILVIITISAAYFNVKALKKRMRSIEQANKEMMSNIAHELKTPMTSIVGFVETLQNGAINDTEKAGKFLEIIAVETVRLQSIIESTLEISRLENLKDDTNKTEFTIDEAIDECLSSLWPIAQQDGISINVFYTDNEKITAFANKVRIKQIITNIVSNAIKYNFKNGKVEITVSKRGKNVRIRVFNTGRGIKNEHFSSLFDRFYRVDDGRAREVGGTGLGLAIVKRIIKLYGGNIDVESVPNENATFIIHLPICKTK